MKKFLMALVVLAIASAPALAGPNEGGVILVHNTGIAFSTDLTLPPVSPVPACAEMVNEVVLPPGPGGQCDPLVWKTYAAFSLINSPRLKALAWGIEYTPGGGGAVVVQGQGQPTPAMFIIASTSPAWPASGSSIAMSFTDSTRTDTVTELWYFWGYAYAGLAGECQTFATTPHALEVNRFFVDDAVPANTDPIAGYGTLGFGCPGYTPCPPGIIIGACCFPDGFCTVATPADCVAAGGSFVGGDCSPSLCPITGPGACCFPNGVCTMLTAADCGAAGGSFVGGACSPDLCPVTLDAACCLTDGTCMMLTEGYCVLAGGTFVGGDCTPGLCPMPVTGACCFPNGVCAMLTAAHCVAAGGSFVGGACLPGLCTGGACCSVDGACTMLTGIDCVAAGGSFVGGDCTPNPCPNGVYGACCYAEGSCAVMTPAQCAGTGGLYWGDGVICTPWLCEAIPTERKSWGQIKNSYR